MQRPFCYKVFDLTTYTYVSEWRDGLVVFESCHETFWRGRICRAYDYHYGKDDPNVSVVPDLVNPTCFNSFGFDDFGFGSDTSTSDETQYSNTYNGGV